MAALSFKGRFVDLIQDGRKKQTIRAFRKYPIEPGETLYLYTGMRTKYCKKIGEVVCSIVHRIEITTSHIIVHYYGLRPHKIFRVKEKDEFAVADGFKNWEEMKRWWTMTHALPFVGQLIKWK